MLKPQKLGKTTRLSFSKINEALEMPNLIDVQKKSFEWFCKEGMMEVLKASSPVNDHSGNLSIEFVDFTIEKTPKYSVEECKERDTTYEAPLKVLVRLANKETGEVKQDMIYMGNIPLMTDSGTFVINGAERVIVSQIVRSPGMYYKTLLDKAGNRSYSVAVIPYRGSYLEYETDSQNVVYVKIDKARKLPVTVLVRALGVETDEEIAAMFGDEDMLTATIAKDECARFADEDNCTLGEAALKEIYKKQRPGDPPIVESAQLLIRNMFFDSKRYDLATVGRYKYDKKLAVADRVRGFALSRPVVSPLTGEILFDADHVMTREDGAVLEQNAVNEVFVRDLMGAEVKVFGNGAVDPAVFGLD
ncbi:MAG: DNA-directed RNA polymerase subunit beta, partial [Clostridia bacterium]|nr:DNA-directed RNA polymerase subunit beta [Clostridia bacterium]